MEFVYHRTRHIGGTLYGMLPQSKYRKYPKFREHIRNLSLLRLLSDGEGIGQIVAKLEAVGQNMPLNIYTEDS